MRALPIFPARPFFTPQLYGAVIREHLDHERSGAMKPLPALIMKNRRNLKEHAFMSADLVSRIRPEYLGFLTLMLEGDTPMRREVEARQMELLDPEEVLVQIAVLTGRRRRKSRPGQDVIPGHNRSLCTAML